MRQPWQVPKPCEIPALFVAPFESCEKYTVACVPSSYDILQTEGRPIYSCNCRSETVNYVYSFQLLTPQSLVRCRSFENRTKTNHEMEEKMLRKYNYTCKYIKAGQHTFAALVKLDIEKS